MRDNFDLFDEHEREEYRQEKLERLYGDPDYEDRRWEELKEAEIESIIRDRQ